jgi:hypothetical protein
MSDMRLVDRGFLPLNRIILMDDLSDLGACFGTGQQGKEVNFLNSIRTPRTSGVLERAKLAVFGGFQYCFGVPAVL